MAAEKMAYWMVENGRTANGVWKGHSGFVKKKKLASKALLLVLAACAMAGCGRRELLQVEQIMECDVETADSLIYSMNEPTGKRSRALYALLKTQIDYKMYRDAVSDSTIRIATDYYGKRYKDYHAAMAWYSLGCISAELGNDSTAADAYLTAIRLFPDTLVRYYALAEQNLSYIYLDHKMDAEAIPLIKSCRANAVRLNDSAAIAFCDYNIAFSMFCNDDYEAAEAIFLKLKDNKWLSPDTKDDPLLQLSKIAQLKDKDYYLSLAYVDSFVVRNMHIVPYGPVYSVKADAFYGLNLIDSAQIYYNRSLLEATDPYITCDSYRRLSEIQSIKGNKDSAAYYSRQASAWMDTIASATDPGMIFRIINRYSPTSFQPRNKRHALLVILIVVSCILIAATNVVLFIINRNRKTKGVLYFAKDINHFKDSALYLEMVKVVHEQEELSSKKKSSFAKKFRKSLTGLREYIIKSSTQMSCMEVDYCIYTILGFKQKDFVLFYNISPSGSRNIKARIKEKTTEQLFKNIFP